MENKLEERTTAETFVMYANLLWHWAWLLALCAILAGGTVFYLSRKQTPVYTASTTIMIDSSPNQSVMQSVDYNQLTTSQQLATTYAQVMTMGPVLQGVANRLKLQSFPDTASITATPVTDTQLITIVVQDTNAKRAALIANTLVQVFSDQVQADHAARYADITKSLQDQKAALEKKIQTTASSLASLGSNTNTPNYAEQQTALEEYRQSYASVLDSLQQVTLLQAQSVSGVIQKDPAIPSDAPISPRPTRDSALAAVTGMLIAAGGVFLIEFLDDTIRDPEEIVRKWGVPILGTIVSYPHDKDTLITAKQPRSPITEAFRSLRTNLQFASFDLPIHTILVTSPSPEDGKTTVAANLASVIAQGGRTAVVVDADMRRPRLHKLLQISNRNGLSGQFIRYQDHLNGSVKPTEIEGLSALTSGNLPPNPSELLGSDRMSEILHELAGRFDTVIVDAPPILVVTDALVLAPCVDGVLVVIKPSITKRGALKNLLEQLRQVNANVLGIVLNDVKVNRSHYYNYHYHGYYYKGKYDKGYGYLEAATEPSEENETPVAEATAPVSKFLKITKGGRKEKNIIDFSEDKTTTPEEPESLPKE